MTSASRLNSIASQWNELQDGRKMGGKEGQALLSQIRNLSEYKDDDVNFTELMARHGHKQSQKYVGLGLA